VILPDAFLALDYMLARARTLLEGLIVRPERMREILDSSHGLVYSQRVLLGLVEGGLTREAAYAVVQRNAMRAWDEARPLGDLLAEDPEVTAVIPPEELEALLDPSWYTRHVPELMERVAAL
jgi:adenylosuccinate lyase